MILILISVEVRVQLTETTLEIIGLLGSEPFNGENIRSLARRLNKAYPLVHTHVTALREEGLVLEKKIGRALQCTLNLAHPESQHLLGFLNARNEQKKELCAQLTKLNQQHPIDTACVYKEKIYLLAENNTARKNLRKELPFNGVEVLNAQQFQKLLLETAKTASFPTPVFHHAIFYDHLSELQQSLWGVIYE